MIYVYEYNYMFWTTKSSMGFILDFERDAAR